MLCMPALLYPLRAALPRALLQVSRRRNSSRSPRGEPTALVVKQLVCARRGSQPVELIREQDGLGAGMSSTSALQCEQALDISNRAAKPIGEPLATLATGAARLPCA